MTLGDLSLYPTRQSHGPENACLGEQPREMLTASTPIRRPGALRGREDR